MHRYTIAINSFTYKHILIMATKTAAKAQTTIEMPDVISFRQMLQSFDVKNKDNAVIARHYAQDMEAFAENFKDAADPILYALKDNAKVLTTDAQGNTWAVSFMPQNQKQYEATDELVAAVEALEAAKKVVTEIQARTPFKMVRKGEKGYSYKVCKP